MARKDDERRGRIYLSRQLAGNERIVSLSRVLRFTSGGRMVVRVNSTD